MIVGADIIGKESGTRFFIFGAELAFAGSRQGFRTVLILYHFDSEYHIEIKINVSGYGIDQILNQQTLDNEDKYY